MARIRTIKPEFWQDEKLAPCDPLTRLVFLGLISMADDCGRLLDNVKVIDAFIFPESDHSSHEALMRLSGMARIRRGKTSSGQKIIQIVNWDAHQKVQHPNLKGSLPEIVDGQALTRPHEPLMNGSGGAREPLTPHTNDLHTNDQRPTTNDLHTNDQKHTVAALPAFEKAWATYPNRQGSNPKPRAEKAWRARIREGVDPEAMLAGLQRYRDYLELTDTAPRFVLQAATFFGPDRLWEDEWHTDQGGMTPEQLRDFGLDPRYEGPAQKVTDAA
jgi:hypothetical protein